MSNVIAVMKDGHIIQIGHPRDIYQSPANQFVADFIGSTNFVRGVVRASANEADPGEIETAHGKVHCPATGGLKTGDAVVGMDDRNIVTADDLILAIRSKRIGDVVTITYYRDAVKTTTLLTLGTSPGS